MKNFHRKYFFYDISRFGQIQGHFQDLENEIVIFQEVWEAYNLLQEIINHSFQFLYHTYTFCSPNITYKVPSYFACLC